jgi:ribosomal silencing factor RsfS
MDITKMDLINLKALQYDFLVESERINANIRAVNEEIAKRVKEEKEAKLIEEKDLPKDEDSRKTGKKNG